MSLVICSNQISDGSSERNRSSIYKAWSFRNQLSSTYKIPANSQVALQSVKVNVDGRVVLSRQNNVFYQYFGKKLNLDGTTSPQIDDVPYAPLRVAMLKRSEISNSVKEFTISDFANRLGEVMSNSIYHPNLQDKASVEILRNASGLDFLGYKLIYDQNLNASNVNGSLTTAEQHFDNDLPRNGSGVFVYDPTHKRLTRDAAFSNNSDLASAIFPDNPLSLSTGNMTVNISGTHANVNASGTQCPWVVGLSRYIANPTKDGFYEPSYSDNSRDADLNLPDGGFMDFGVGRNEAGQLVCFQSAWDETFNCIRRYEIEYWSNTNGSFSGLSARKSLVSGKYDKVRFTGTGEQLKVEIQNTTGGKNIWETITSYFGGAAGDKDAQYGPIHQACWCLHPVLEIGRNASNTTGKMNFTHIKTPPIVNYDVKKPNRSGWWETLELLGTAGKWCKKVESRPILDISNTAVLYTQVGVDGSGRITGLNNVMILEQSDIYQMSFGANAKQILGFNPAVIDTPDSVSPTTFHSNFAPSLVSSQAMFVRLDNFNQRVVNALTGNKSQIIGHLPRFDSSQTTGRLFFEPKNFVWIDLDNTNDITVSDFNISFCYSNEQYAEILTGQSIVVLYFRKKPKELM